MVDDTETPDQRVTLVRHAETAWSLTGQHTGMTDLPLTRAGEAATEHLGQRLRARSFAWVLTSPLERAATTCRIAGFTEVAEVRDDLVEWDYGAYEGRTTAEIRADEPDWDIWQHGAPGGESPDDIAARMDGVVGALRQACAGERDVLVFGHGHSLTALAVRWLGLAVSHGRHLRLGAGSISTLGWKRGVPVLEGWNDRSHLPGAP